MIVISDGQPKSGSTYIFTLACLMAEQVQGVGMDEIRQRYLPEPLQTYFLAGLDHVTLDTLRRAIPEDLTYVFKTHTVLTPEIAETLESKEVRACVSIRDPRDAALSLVDAGRLDEARESERLYFRRFKTASDGVGMMRYNIERMRAWVSSPHVLTVPFDDIAERPYAVGQALARHLDLNIDTDAIVADLAADLTAVDEFNKGVRDRHLTEMSPKELALFEQELGAEIAWVNEQSRRHALTGQRSGRLVK